MILNFIAGVFVGDLIGVTIFALFQGLKYNCWSFGVGRLVWTYKKICGIVVLPNKAER